jgi:hypothetical protein
MSSNRASRILLPLRTNVVQLDQEFISDLSTIFNQGFQIKTFVEQGSAQFVERRVQFGILGYGQFHNLLSPHQPRQLAQ